eukprot:c25377_g1_i6 orf=236-457(+)
MISLKCSNSLGWRGLLCLIVRIYKLLKQNPISRKQLKSLDYELEINCSSLQSAPPGWLGCACTGGACLQNMPL